MNDMNTRKRLDFSFSELRYNIIQIQKISSKIEQDGKAKKFETARIHFFVTYLLLSLS